MVEGTALEMRHTRKGIVGSNPTLSAKLFRLIDVRPTVADRTGTMIVSEFGTSHGAMASAA